MSPTPDHPPPDTDADNDSGRDSAAPRASSPSNGPRTAQACDKCRERKTKCSGERPSCARCSGRSLICHYSVRAGRTKHTRVPSPARSGEFQEDTLPKKAHHTVYSLGAADGVQNPIVARAANAHKHYKCPTPSYLSPAPFSNFPKNRGPPAPVPVNAGVAASLTPIYEYQPAPTRSSRFTPRSGSQDPLPEPTLLAWGASYSVAKKTSPESAMAGLGGLRLGGFPGRDHDLITTVTRGPFSDSLDERGMVGGQANGFYPLGPSHGFARDARTAASCGYDQGGGCPSPSFLEFANSFAPSSWSAVTSPTATTTTSSHLPCTRTRG